MAEKHVVVTSATCRCSFGKTPDILAILTNTDVHANDSSGIPKFIASTADIGKPFLLNFFGPCSKLYNIPCTILVANWIDFDERITLPNGANILIEDSKATCLFGAPGCISVVHHGQISELSTQQFEKTDPEVSFIINPAVDTRDIYDDPGIPFGISIS